MLKRLASFLLAITILFGSFIGMVSFAEEANESESKYEIYPIPQKEAYLGANFNLTNEVNLVIEEGVDKSTKDFLNNIAKSKFNNLIISEELTEDKTNLIVGIKDSNGYVDEYFNDIKYDDTIFTEDDAYVLNIENGTIAILGGHTDAVYYGLATLNMIFDQIESKEIQSVKYEDYADTEFRGFIEGFYGFPWSHENRKSLMEFGGKFKMNTYIFAPKDDIYHNKEWRTLYPAEELVKIKELVDVGHETKTQFVWAIHPGFNMINWDDYDNELQTLLNKLEQLYSIGVRQFGLFMDDIDTAQALKDKDKHVKLITDVANWTSSKGDCKPLVFCPTFYTKLWANKSYLKALKETPDNVRMVWTGRWVCSPVEEKDLQWPKKYHERDPYMWLNWPVNDYMDSRLMLGKGELLKPGVESISGLVSNPMNQAELSKIALFAVADYGWNIDGFNDDKSWVDSFKYIVPEVASELNTIAHHLSTPGGNNGNLDLTESENIKEELEGFLDSFQNGEILKEDGNKLITEFDNVLSAIDTFKRECNNENMIKEISPWLNCLEELTKSCKYATKSAIALQEKDMEIVWSELTRAINALEQSKGFKVKRLNSPDITVEAGTKRLVPFVEKLIEILDKEISTYIEDKSGNPTAEKKVSVYTNVSDIKDVSLTTQELTVEISDLKNITLAPSEYIGIKLPFIEKISEISYDGTSTKITIESSKNGVEWKEESIDGQFQDAAYIRVINKNNENIIFDLDRLFIKLDKFAKPSIIHNYSKIHKGDLGNLIDGNLETKVLFGDFQNEGKYVQLDLGGIEEIKKISIVTANGERDYFREGDVQVSLDGNEWETVYTFNNPEKLEDNFPEFENGYRFNRINVDNKKGRYVRLISTKESDKWLVLSEIIINEGLEDREVYAPAYETNLHGKKDHEITKIADNDLLTSYIPKEDGAGYLNYKISDSTKLSEIIILQNAAGISNAQVSIRDLEGWHEVGTLSKAFNSIDTSNYEHVLEVKLEWDGNIKPIISEIIPIAKTETEEPEDSDYPLSIGKVEKIEEDNKLTIKLNVKNSSKENVDGVAILKLKDDNNRNYKVEYKDIKVDEENNIIEFELDLTNYPKEIKGIKVYIWDSLDNMKPLADVKEEIF